MADYLIHHNANTHWGFPTSAETDEALSYAREAVAEFLNASATEIVFGLNMTTLTFHLARAIGRRLEREMRSSSPSLTITPTSTPGVHSSVNEGSRSSRPEWSPETGELDWNDLDHCLTDHRVKLLAIGAASNALGTINDVARAVAMAREAKALSFVDAVHYAPHQLVDVREWGCDFLACSAYKFHGPHVGVLYGKREQLEMLDVPKLGPRLTRCPRSWKPGRKTTRESSAHGRRGGLSGIARQAGHRNVVRARGANDCRRCSRRFTSGARRF